MRNYRSHRSRLRHSSCRNGTRCCCRTPRSTSTINSTIWSYRLFISIQEPQVSPVANPVQDNQHKIATYIHHMQAMIQSMKLQYAATQPYYQYYVGYGRYRGNKGFRGSVESCWQHWWNWKGGHGGRGSSGIDNYCCTHGMYNHQGYNFRTLHITTKIMRPLLI